MNSCLVQEEGTESDCSSLFENIHPAFTIAQACIAAGVLILGVSLNLVLTMALIKFRHLMDEAFILCISVFIANVVVSLSIGIGMVSSAATRSWPLGYGGCQILGFLSHMAIVSRWITLGMLSIDRFCRVFFTYCYPRHSKTVLKIMAVFPWIVVAPRCILSLFNIHTKFDFSAALPGCFYRSNCNGSAVCINLVYADYLLVLASGSCLPIVLYSILYIKGRRLLRATETHPLPAPSEQEEANNRRQRKATKTFALMVITFSVYSAMVILLIPVETIPALQNITGLNFLVNDLTLMYIITDFLLVWKNENGKQVIKKFINTVLYKQVFTMGTSVPPVVNAPPVKGPQNATTNTPIIGSVQERPDNSVLGLSIPSVEHGKDQEQLYSSMPGFIPALDQ